MLIAHFRSRYDRWIKEVKTHFFIALASIWSNIFTKSNEKKTCLFTLSIVYIEISNTYLPEFLNILLYVGANPVLMCR